MLISRYWAMTQPNIHLVSQTLRQDGIPPVRHPRDTSGMSSLVREISTQRGRKYVRRVSRGKNKGGSAGLTHGKRCVCPGMFFTVIFMINILIHMY